MRRFRLLSEAIEANACDRHQLALFAWSGNLAGEWRRSPVGTDSPSDGAVVLFLREFAESFRKSWRTHRHFSVFANLMVVPNLSLTLDTNTQEFVFSERNFSISTAGVEHYLITGDGLVIRIDNFRAQVIAADRPMIERKKK